MKIGIDCRMFSSSFTGIGRYTFELVENLQRLAAQANQNPVPSSSSATNARAHSSSLSPHQFVLFFNEPEFSSYTPKNPNFKKVLVNAKHYSIKEQTKFLKILKRENLDLMHFTHFNAPLRYDKPFIVTIHDLTHTLFPGRKMTSFPYRVAYKMVVKNAVRRARRIIAVSKNTKEDLIKILKVDPSKIDVIYEGVNDEFHQLDDEKRKEAEKSLSAKYGINKPFLLYTGVHRYHKNLPRLVEAFKIVSDKFSKSGKSSANQVDPEVRTTHELSSSITTPLTNARARHLQLVITGKKDPLYPEAEKLVKSFNLEEKVIFTGLIPEEEIIALYNLASTYVFPSLYEGFGLPILEAFACGTPVAASNVSSIPEIAGQTSAPQHTQSLPGQTLSVRPQDLQFSPNAQRSPEAQSSPNAILFDPTDIQDIAAKIEQILDSPTLQKRLIAGGLKRVKDFSWEKMAKEIFGLYNNIPVTRPDTVRSSLPR